MTPILSGTVTGLRAFAARVERQASRVPTELFVWSGMAAAATSIGFLAAGKRHASMLTGLLVPTLLLCAVYGKLAAAERPSGASVH